jgi:hypothetical protein
MKLVQTAAKAVFATVLTFVTGLGAALTTGESLGQVDAKTWLYVAGLSLVSGGGVYGITNRAA